MAWSDYVIRVVAGDDQVTIAKKTGVNQSTVSNWRGEQTQQPSPAHVAAFARAYHRNVLEAFVAAGFLTSEEAGMAPPTQTDLPTVIDADAQHVLVLEVRLRFDGQLLVRASDADRKLGRPPRAEPEKPDES